MAKRSVFMLEISIAVVFSLFLLLFGFVFFDASARHKLCVDLVINTLSDVQTPQIISTLELQCFGSVLAVVKKTDAHTIEAMEKQYKIDKIIYI